MNAGEGVYDSLQLSPNRQGIQHLAHERRLAARLVDSVSVACEAEVGCLLRREPPLKSGEAKVAEDGEELCESIES